MILLIILFLQNGVLSHVNGHVTDNSRETRKPYYGENFPVAFLVPESTCANDKLMFKYLDALKRTLSYFNKSPNQTDCNTAIGVFYAKVISKRTSRDYKARLQKQHLVLISDIIKICENILSHYFYLKRKNGWQSLEYRFTELLSSDDEPQVYSIGAFNAGQFTKWLHIDTNNVNEYSADFDDISLPRSKYVEFIVRCDEFFIKPTDSNFCITNIPYNPEPLELSLLRPCRPEPYCLERLHTPPSTAYTLSHRLLNILMRHQIRRCYMTSEEEDISHLELLCAFMYRETVYLARRGYFVRDIFMEHVAFCALLGYEEFHRLLWFDKVESWIDEHGCVSESMSFENIYSHVLIQRADSKEEARELREYFKNMEFDKCNHHAMALALIVMAHSARYATHSVYQKQLNEK